ncbi:DUF305 domain-containing protein [Streptomyces sp. NPDC093085]|uniref:DUF305 domain-containing protein n=1 Tax=Streptomyces sp. NPDC093085 TaxID=3155068 RepID=UPI00342F28E2
MTRTQWVALTAVLLALVFAGTAALASGGGTGASGGAGAGGSGRTPSSDSADAGFARDMAVHHQQAVEMSFLVRDSTDDEDVRRLAYDIANTQANQRGMLLGWLELWGLPKTDAGKEPMEWMAGEDGMGDMAGMDHGADGADGAHGGHQAHDGSLMPGMATNTELKQLREARGKAAEVLFLQLMTDHHKGGVSMAQGCVTLCTNATEKKLAEGMVAAQRSEMTLMADMLKQRGAKARS